MKFRMIQEREKGRTYSPKDYMIFLKATVCTERASGFFLSTEPASVFGHFSLYWYMGLLPPFHFFLNSHDCKEPSSDMYETLPALYHGLQST